MPELPEVETTRRGLLPHLEGRRITAVTLRRETLRWPIPQAVHALAGQRIHGVERRAKYLLMRVDEGAALWHLGMSGTLRMVTSDVPARLHDHVDIALESGQVLRFNDPRRFGCLLWQPAGEIHPLLQALGPEPLSDAFHADWLWRMSRGRRQAVKPFLMDQRIVVGVGNIYANEALFAAGIRPTRAAGRLTRHDCERLCREIRRILSMAIERGGTTLRDFLAPDGLPGYFEQELLVYGREGEACKVCGAPLKSARIGQRATVWCPRCQR